MKDLEERESMSKKIKVQEAMRDATLKAEIERLKEDGMRKLKEMLEKEQTSSSLSNVKDSHLEAKLNYKIKVKWDRKTIKLSDSEIEKLFKTYGEADIIIKPKKGVAIIDFAINSSAV